MLSINKYLAGCRISLLFMEKQRKKQSLCLVFQCVTHFDPTLALQCDQRG